LQQVLHFDLLYQLRGLIDQVELVRAHVAQLGQLVLQDRLLQDLMSLEYIE